MILYKLRQHTYNRWKLCYTNDQPVVASHAFDQYRHEGVITFKSSSEARIILARYNLRVSKRPHARGYYSVYSSV